MKSNNPYRLYTTKRATKYKIGDILADVKHNRMVKVISIQRVIESGEWVYDIYVIATQDNTERN